ncbi:hypothetical protein BVH03_18305 [Pseudomonas sp. PA15(2017)]|uniref:hypothetical protein n=1 Tax=Pseudomonas sp. PA15(2017) TaxID=1932111 RepID=UPI00095F8EEC|nr:hypothetical protein [Pseudomonas sp. PA15(2017)]OLU25588.1 hypothetical protein BVH03_18305 [Pseudomonas sp. PA15(2017)]
MMAISGHKADQLARWLFGSLRALRARLAPPRFDNLSLDGETTDGRHIHLSLTHAQLRDTAALGRGSGEPYHVVAPRQGAAHITLRLYGDTLYVRREGLVGSASLNARVLRVHRQEVLEHGDWLCLDGQVLRLTLHRGAGGTTCGCAGSYPDSGER